jgi:hypothetical protein
MKHLLLLLVILLTISSSVIACVNEYTTNIYGHETEGWDKIPVFNKGFDKRRSELFLEEHKLEKINSYDHHVQSDIAVHLAKLGRFKQSLEFYKGYIRATLMSTKLLRTLALCMN